MMERGSPVVRNSILNRLGDASYSLYLSHGIVLSAASQIWRKVGLTQIPGSFTAFTILSVLLAIVVAMLMYQLVERPLLDAFRRKRPKTALS